MPTTTLRRLSLLTLGLCAGSLPALADSPRIVVSPVAPTTSDRPSVIILGDLSESCTLTPYFGFFELDGFDLLFDGKAAPVPCPDPSPWSRELELPALAAGTYQVRVEINDQPYASTSFTVEPAAREMVIAPNGVDYFGTYFRATVDFALPDDPAQGAPTRPASASPLTRSLTPNGGYFWFFSPENPEVTLKILDGRTVNGHYWLFLSTLTSLAHTVRVRLCVDGDPPYCEEPREYHSQAGHGLDVIDVEAFGPYDPQVFEPLRSTPLPARVERPEPARRQAGDDVTESGTEMELEIW